MVSQQRLLKMAVGGIWELLFPSVTTFDLWNGIPAELFQILKDDAINVLHSLCQQIWKLQQLPQNWKRSLLIPIPQKAKPSNYYTIALISHMPARLCSKSSKLGFSSTGTKNFQMYKLGLEKAKEPEIKWPTDSLDHRESKGIPEKHLLLLH